MRGVVFLVQRLVADHGPARGLHHLHVEAVLGVEAHRVRHDDGRGAGDGDETDLEVFLLGRGGLGEHLGGQPEREELRDGGERRRGADRAQEGAPRAILGEQRAHDRRLDDARWCERRPMPGSPCRARPGWHDLRSCSRACCKERSASNGSSKLIAAIPSASRKGNRRAGLPCAPTPDWLRGSNHRASDCRSQKRSVLRLLSAGTALQDGYMLSVVRSQMRKN